MWGYILNRFIAKFVFDVNFIDRGIASNGFLCSFVFGRKKIFPHLTEGYFFVYKGSIAFNYMFVNIKCLFGFLFSSQRFFCFGVAIVIPINVMSVFFQKQTIYIYSVSDFVNIFCVGLIIFFVSTFSIWFFGFFRLNRICNFFYYNRFNGGNRPFFFGC